MREQNVINYYVMCNRLKNVIRKGWKDWNVKRERIESVAEHVYSTQMLALAIYSEYEYDLDINKVILMLEIHELGETVIGDLTLFDIDKKEKEKIEHEAVHKILEPLKIGPKVEDLFLEFDARETEEAKFAYLCDKFEAELQSKLYDEEGCVDLYNQKDNKSYYDDDVQDLLKKGYSFSDMWLEFGQRRYPYDKNFKELSDYVRNNDLN